MIGSLTTTNQGIFIFKKAVVKHLSLNTFLCPSCVSSLHPSKGKDLNNHLTIGGTSFSWWHKILANLLTVLHPHPFLGTKATLKCRFYYPDMMRPSDQRMIGIEKTVCCSQVPRGEAKPCHGVGVQREALELIGDRGKEGTVGKGFYCGFRRKE